MEATFSLSQHERIEKIILKQMDRWSDCEASKNVTLLRLSILKDLLHQLRQEKSQCLALGLKEEIDAIKKIEKKIEALREADLSENNFKQTIENPSQVLRKKRLIPEDLFSVFSREELTRFDRVWENTLIAEGLVQGWNLWSLEIFISVNSIPDWKIYFSQHLWPHGLIVLSEDRNPPPESPLHESDYEFSRWFFLLNSQFQHPLDLSPHLLKWEGILDVSPSSSIWKLVYPDSVTW